MKNYQKQLIEMREKQKLTTEAIASQLSISDKTIQMLEDSNDIFALDIGIPPLKSYYRKYAEALNMPEKKILALLNHIDYLDYKHHRRGRMTGFDYLNRLVILILLAALGYSVYNFYLTQQAEAQKQNVVMLGSPLVDETSGADQSKTDTTITTAQADASVKSTDTANSSDQKDQAR
ncbi:MAG: helix-turn-helix domain-containing protein [Francisellaceae bacterium]